MGKFQKGHKINLGKIKTEEHKRKLSESHKGKIKTEEHRRKLSESLNGHSVSKETRDKISNAHKGKILSEETKGKIGEASRGEKNPMYGKHFFHTEEAKKKISEAMLGEKHWNWQDGKTLELYPLNWTDDLREVIRKRDSHICLICGIHQDELDSGQIKKLDIHHIDYDKNNLSPDNLISLCRSCHMKTNINREYWTNYFNE